MDRPTRQHSGDQPAELTGGWNNVSRTRPVTGFQEAQNAYQRRMEHGKDAELATKRFKPEVSANTGCNDHLLEKRDKVQFMNSGAPFSVNKLGLDSGGGPSSADSEIQPNLFSACEGGYRLPQRSYQPPSSEWVARPLEPMTAPRLNEGGPRLAQTSSAQSMDTFPKARPKGVAGSGMSAAGNYSVPMIPHRHYSLVREVLEAAAEGAAKLKQQEAEAQKAAKANRFGGT